MAPHLENLAVSNSHDVFHPGSLVWALPDASAKGIQKDTNKGKSYTRSEDCRKDGFWRRGVVESVSGDGNDPVAVLVKFENGEISMVKAAECFLQNDRDDNVDDLVRSDFLHEPGCVISLSSFCVVQKPSLDRLIAKKIQIMQDSSYAES